MNRTITSKTVPMRIKCHLQTRGYQGYGTVKKHMFTKMRQWSIGLQYDGIRVLPRYPGYGTAKKHMSTTYNNEIDNTMVLEILERQTLNINHFCINYKQ